jgi:hypothetical protein
MNLVRLATVAIGALYAHRSNHRTIWQMAIFNKIFSTQRLLQIIAILGATVIMKLLLS